MASLEGKVAFVTGSSRGIGAAIAKAFTRAGARVAIHGRDEAALEKVRADTKAALVVAADVTKFEEIERARVRVEAAMGPIDILVANAGGSFTPPGPIEEITEEGWRSSVDGNLTATFLTVKSVLPGMKARRSGNIITMSSAAARRPHSGSPVGYAAAKAGIQIFTQDLALQAGPFGIRVNCIAPETILTERNEQRIPPDVKEKLVSAHAIRRLGIPDDVAQAAVFLASDESSWITGIILDIAGGSTVA
jgi:3-oxoacyl-[acyl-carrier protein] reductase